MRPRRRLALLRVLALEQALACTKDAPLTPAQQRQRAALEQRLRGLPAP